MLETLLNHFRSYGLNDLEFIIVNSKISHSQDMLHELKDRVSFEVYQETEEEEVWNLMEGGKDDMYIYDRCGRLTFYIPFPLSMLNESPLVANAILTTYFRSPCGDNCDQNKTMDQDEFVRNLGKDLESSNETEQVNETLTATTELPSLLNKTFNETHLSNDLLNVIGPEQEIDVTNSSLFSNITDYDYPDYNNITFTNDTNNTSIDKAKTYFNSIYKLFFDNEMNNEEKSVYNETLMNETAFSTDQNHSITHNFTEENNEHITNVHHHSDHHHSNHTHHKNEHKHNLKGRRKSDRCLEADYHVCKSWTKKRLLHAQKCCSGKTSEAVIEDPRSCDHFGKKRCKKIQSILKCCIKTLYTESPVITVTTEKTSQIEEESLSSPEKDTSSSKISDITCCKKATVEDSGMLCRVVNSGRCNEDEEILSSPNQSK